MEQAVYKQTLNDKEAEIDQLGISDYVEACAKFIMTCETPVTVAIQGGWGTGKSSFMNMMKKELEGNAIGGKEAVMINFNTWQYSRIENERLFLPLLSTLIDEIDSKNNKSQDYVNYFINPDDPSKDTKKSLFKWFGSTAVLAGGALAGQAGSAVVLFGQLVNLFANRKSDDAQNTADQNEQTNINEQKDNSENLQTYYKEMVEVRKLLQDRIYYLTGRKKIKNGELKDAGDAKKRLIVFVDDLDRLRPVDAVSLLEDMKNFMDCEETVFVLALDHSLVQRGVKEKYRESIDDSFDDEYARKFFEKIVQVPFYLPVNKYNITNYIKTLVKDNEIEGLDINQCVRSVEVLSDGNPRVIKRALRMYKLNNLITTSQKTSNNPNSTFALILLQMCHEDAFNDLAENLGNLSRDNKVSDLFENDKYASLENALKNSKETRFNMGYYSYLKELTPYYSQLLHEVRTNSFLAPSEIRTKETELDEIYKLLCDYLKEKGFEKVAEKQFEKGSSGNEQSEWEKDQAKITVIRFSNNANINFNTLSNPESYIQKYLKEGIIKEPANNKEQYFSKHPLSYMKNDRCLFIHLETVDAQILHIIGDIVNACLKQNKAQAKKVQNSKSGSGSSSVHEPRKQGSVKKGKKHG